MGKRKEEDDTFLSKKKNRSKNMISVDGKETVFSVNLKLQGIS